MHKPRIGITMGDPAGIGPEIVVKAVASSEQASRCRPLLFGNLEVFRATAERLGLDVTFQQSVGAEPPAGNAVPVVDAGDEREASAYELGTLSAAAGEASFRYVEEATRRLLKGELDALTTAPVSKEAIALAGIPFPGHLEYLAERTGAQTFAPLLGSGENLRVVHLSSHHSTVDACALVTKDHILSKLELIRSSGPQLGFPEPSIAVAALNPHGGEGGLLGREEIDEIEPAIEAARALGIDASGPYPADTVFTRAIEGEFDFVLALYHDQGHIAIKVHDFANSYAVSIGLPIVRTSVDHGTAFGIAGRGIADPRGLQRALREAIDIVHRSRAEAPA